MRVSLSVCACMHVYVCTYMCMKSLSQRAVGRLQQCVCVRACMCTCVCVYVCVIS